MLAALDRLFAFAGHLAGVFMIGTLVSVLFSIVGRLVPMLDLPGSDAYAGYFMAAAAFLALAPTLRRGEHIRVTLIADRLPPGGHRALEIFCHLVGTAIAIAFAVYSVRLVFQSRTFSDVSTGLDATPLWIPQIGMAVGTSLSALAFLTDLVLVLSGRVLREERLDGEPAHVE